MLREDVSRITTWLQSRLPDYEVAVGEQADAIDWKISAGDGLPPSHLRVPEDYFANVELGVDQILGVLERTDFAEMVESEDGICRVVTRNQSDPADELVLGDC